MSSNRDVYERGIQLFNTGDVDGLADLYTEDAVLVAPFGTAQGRAAIRKYWSRGKAAFPDGTLTMHVIVEQGDSFAGEYTLAGTHTGPLVLPDGTEVPATGKRVENMGMNLARMRDGKIAVQHLYHDNMAYLRQLGLLPGTAVR